MDTTHASMRFLFWRSVMSIAAMMNVWKHSKSKGSELLMLLTIADYANQAGECYPSVKTLATKMRLSERATQYLIKRLVINEEIMVFLNEGKNGCNIYKLNREKYSSI